jgi:predicted CopG family antitoxin|tara:strand:+ start:103 stop:285 length:183 start_codon:yes stop_codon:yes gene_type:complete
MKQSKWHTISIPDKSYEKLQDIKNKLPIRTSNPQVIDWLIEIGQKQIQGAINDNTSRIPK